jgi:hypothetical protein
MPKRTFVMLLALAALAAPVRAEPVGSSDADLDRPLDAPAPARSLRSSPKRAASPPPASQRPRTVAREIQPGSSACENARDGVRRLEASIASIESDIERLEEHANDIELHADTRDRYEERMESAEERLAQAEDRLHEYVLSQQQKGVPQGCLR